MTVGWVCLHHKRIFKTVQSPLWHQHGIQKQAGLPSAQMPTNERTTEGLQSNPGCRDAGCPHTWALGTDSATYRPLCPFPKHHTVPGLKGTLWKGQTGLVISYHKQAYRKRGARCSHTQVSDASGGLSQALRWGLKIRWSKLCLPFCGYHLD